MKTMYGWIMQLTSSKYMPIWTKYIVVFEFIIYIFVDFKPQRLHVAEELHLPDGIQKFLLQNPAAMKAVCH